MKIMIVACVLVLFLGCIIAFSQTNRSSVLESVKIVGTWKMESVENPATPFPFKSQIITFTSTNTYQAEFQLRFKQNEQSEYKNLAGTYKVSGTNLTMFRTENKTGENYIIERKGDILRMTSPGDATIIFRYINDTPNKPAQSPGKPAPDR